MTEGTVHQDSLLDQWLSAGQGLYEAALNEFRAMEAEADDMQNRIDAKRAQINQIARLVGRPPVDAPPAYPRIASKPIENPSADETLRMLATARCGAYAG